ncbi:Zinc finger BED domain-containing protein 4 [Merluccius polli]|uniref:Zinc finger BED domain-containing protein 4 n=1 Tax=Merluccius polli TaxID=89951 RepID=A0AA47P2K7_MERPO|nr:Zinc finger BED domain-containing protein 4 [Merluccius polli]
MCTQCGSHNRYVDFEDHRSIFNSDNISLELKRITDEWAITQKVIAVVTDNGANMVSAVHKAGWKHYPCIAHTLNLVVKDGIKAVHEVVQLLTTCSSIVSFFHHSAKATEKLKQIQKQLKVAEHKLIQSVETRWNSVFYMLERLHEQREAVTTALCLLGKNSLCLNDEEFSMIHLTVEALRPFEEVRREVSSEKYVSVSKVIPLVSLLQRAAAATEHQGSCLIPWAKFCLSTSVKFCLCTWTKLCLTRESCTYFQLCPTQQHCTTGTDVLIEMHRYMEEKPVPRDQDPLLWWKGHEQAFPSLSRLAAKYLGITASSVPRIFSKAGELVSQRRNRLKGDHVRLCGGLDRQNTGAPALAETAGLYPPLSPGPWGQREVVLRQGDGGSEGGRPVADDPLHGGWREPPEEPIQGDQFHHLLTGLNLQQQPQPAALRSFRLPPPSPYDVRVAAARAPPESSGSSMPCLEIPMKKINTLEIRKKDTCSLRS